MLIVLDKKKFLVLHFPVEAPHIVLAKSALFLHTIQYLGKSNI